MPFAFAFLDCEFGGLDPEQHDITEIGVIVTDYRLAERGEKEWKVLGRPERITPEAAAIFRYDPEVWAAEGVPVRRALTELAALLPAGHTVVPAGQNVRMDVQFLERAYRRCGIPYPFDYHVVDLATLFYAWSLVAGETVPALSLRQAATQAGLAQGSVAHRALADARLTLETFRHYVGRLAPRPLPENAAPPLEDGSGNASPTPNAPGSVSSPASFMKPVVRTSRVLEIRGPRTGGRRRRTGSTSRTAAGRRSRRSSAFGVRSRALMKDPG